MSTTLVTTAFLALALGVPIALGVGIGFRNARSMTGGLNHPDRCGVTPPGRLIDKGVVMDPDRLRRAVE